MTVQSIASFIGHLSVMAEKVLLAEHQALKKAAQLVEAEARSEFGVYQGPTGQFGKWDELADSTKAYRVAQGYTENEPLLRSGTLRDSISNQVHGLKAVIGSTSDVMVYQELGTATIPPRAVLGPALLRSDKKILEIVGVYTAGAMLSGSGFSHLPTIRMKQP